MGLIGAGNQRAGPIEARLLCMWVEVVSDDPALPLVLQYGQHDPLGHTVQLDFCTTPNKSGRYMSMHIDTFATYLVVGSDGATPVRTTIQQLLYDECLGDKFIVGGNAPLSASVAITDPLPKLVAAAAPAEHLDSDDDDILPRAKHARRSSARQSVAAQGLTPDASSMRSEMDIFAPVELDVVARDVGMRLLFCSCTASMLRRQALCFNLQASCFTIQVLCVRFDS
jgi:hypothetical protein